MELSWAFKVYGNSVIKIILVNLSDCPLILPVLWFIEKTPNLQKLLQLPQRTRVNCTKGCDKPFLKLIPFQMLLFLLDLRKFINNLFIHPLQSTLAKFSAYFLSDSQSCHVWPSFYEICKIKKPPPRKQKLGPHKT